MEEDHVSDEEFVAVREEDFEYSSVTAEDAPLGEEGVPVAEEAPPRADEIDDMFRRLQLQMTAGLEQRFREVEAATARLEQLERQFHDSETAAAAAAAARHEELDRRRRDSDAAAAAAAAARHEELDRERRDREAAAAAAAAARHEELDRHRRDGAAAAAAAFDAVRAERRRREDAERVARMLRELDAAHGGMIVGGIVGGLGAGVATGVLCPQAGAAKILFAAGAGLAMGAAVGRAAARFGFDEGYSVGQAVAFGGIGGGLVGALGGRCCAVLVFDFDLFAKVYASVKELPDVASVVITKAAETAPEALSHLQRALEIREGLAAATCTTATGGAAFCFYMESGEACHVQMTPE